MIQSINRALDILEFLADSHGIPRTPSEIAGAAGLNRATASNIIKTLAGRNYLEQEGPRKGYVPGIMCGMLENEETFRSKLVRTASPFMEELARSTGETVLIAVLKNNRRFILHQVEGGEPVQVRSGFISDTRVQATATGKLLLAYLPEKELDSFIRGQNLKGGDEKKLREAVKNGAKEGCSVHEPPGGQVAGVAFKVERSGRTVAALGLYLPAFRFKGYRRKDIMRRMKNSAGKISNNLR